MIRSFNGKTPKIARSAFVSEAAYIVGDVEIGEESSVWPGAVIRGDFGSIRIGAKTTIEDGCIVHAGSPTSPVGDLDIGDNVHIGHGVVINCRSIGDGVLIGMNATLLHDTEIGELCVIGASCLVGQGLKIPARSFVAGVPGKVKGQVTEEQLWWVREGSKLYEDMARRYKEEGL